LAVSVERTNGGIRICLERPAVGMFSWERLAAQVARLLDARPRGRVYRRIYHLVFELVGYVNMPEVASTCATLLGKRADRAILTIRFEDGTELDLLGNAGRESTWAWRPPD